ncbi:MAG TPA: DAK2 domain-containing protein [Frankiaceae bacterium]|jgi:hypothetical protein|nr:DAK2 domain-containing protein [Frankiaceae bacterium]
MPAALDRLDAAAVRRWLSAAHRALVTHQREIDDLNVYPVPDGDTGTNLVLTMASVSSALDGAAADLAGTLNAAARGALLGARGNSGVILSQLLRGIADAAGAGSAGDVRKALRRATELAYAAVAAPVEGTILSVARAAADAADEVAGDDLCDVVRAACEAAAEALRLTPSQLPALAAAGVVDAGGRGLCVVLDALRSVVTGEEVAVEPEPLVSRPRSALAVARESGSEEYAYEVQYLLDAVSTDALRERLAGLGDSLVVVGGDGLWNVHVHVNDVGAAVEAGIEAGRPYRIAVTRFADQIAASEAEASREVSGRAVVAVVAGDGLAELYEAVGATVVRGGPSACPSTGMLLDAVLATHAAQVVLLPNDSNVFGPANAAAEEARAVGRDVHVVPTRSPVQGLAALAVAEPGKPFADDAIAMSAAASATRWAEVTTAVRDAQTSVGACRAGDVLGLVLGDVAVIGSSVEDVGAAVLDRMLGGGGELVTIVVGADAAPGLGEALAERVAASYPLVEAEVHAGGQPHYPLLLGVE